MMNCITMRRVLSSPVAKYFLFAFSILIVFCCCCLRPPEAMALTSSSVYVSTSNISDVFPHGFDVNTNPYMYYYGFSDNDSSMFTYPRLLRLSDSPPYNVYEYYNDPTSSEYYFYNFYFLSDFSFPTLDEYSLYKIHISFYIWSSGPYNFSYDQFYQVKLVRSDGVSSVYSPSSVTFLDSTSFGLSGIVSFDFVVDGSFLIDSSLFLYASSPESSRYSGLNIGFSSEDPFTLTGYNQVEDQAAANASAIAGIGSGTPPVDFSGSQSQVNNITSQMGSFDDTYKVDTDQVDQNFTDSLNWLSDGNLTSGFGAVGGWVDRFLSDNKIWMSVITFCLCFGLALFAIGRGVSIGNSQARERNRRNRGR